MKIGMIVNCRYKNVQKPLPCPYSREKAEAQACGRVKPYKFDGFSYWLSEFGELIPRDWDATWHEHKVAQSVIR
jgi:hypothetical protein